jgi:hypothetical protein
LFAATVAGLGLTGLIVEVELQLRPIGGPWLEAETVSFNGLADFFSLSDESEAGWEHTVSWIDCTSGSDLRGLFMRARPAAGRTGQPWRERSRRVPFTPPVSMVNRLSLKPFNALYYNLGRRRTGLQVVHYEPFLYPLRTISTQVPGPVDHVGRIVPERIRLEASGLRLGRIQVPTGAERGADDDLPGLVHPAKPAARRQHEHLGLGQGAPDRLDAGRQLRGQRVKALHQGGFRRPVQVCRSTPPGRLAPAQDHLVAQRLAREKDPAERRECGVRRRTLEPSEGAGGHGVHHGDGLASQPPEHVRDG